MILKIPTVRVIFINGCKKVQHWNLTLIFHIILSCSIYNPQPISRTYIFNQFPIIKYRVPFCPMFVWSLPFLNLFFFTFGFRFCWEEDNIFFLFNVVTERKEIEVKNKLWLWLAISLSDWNRWLNLLYICILDVLKPKQIVCET